MTLTDLVPGALDIATAFNLVTGGDLLPLGFASFRSGPAGEVGVEGTRWCQDGGICYLDADLDEIPIEPPRVGWVAVGGAGFNPAAPLPVAPATWGGIKVRYQARTER